MAPIFYGLIHLHIWSQHEISSQLFKIAKSCPSSAPLIRAVLHDINIYTITVTILQWPKLSHFKGSIFKEHNALMEMQLQILNSCVPPQALHTHTHRVTGGAPEFPFSPQSHSSSLPSPHLSTLHPKLSIPGDTWLPAHHLQEGRVVTAPLWKTQICNSTGFTNFWARPDGKAVYFY